MEYDKTPSIASINYMNPRESLHHIRKLSDSSSVENNVNGDRQWRLSYLKNQFRSFNLDHLFKRYTQRINHGYFSLFLLLQGILSATHFIVVLIPNVEDKTLHMVLPDLILYGMITVLPIIGLFVTDAYVQKYPVLLNVMSLIAFIMLYIVNFLIPIYHGITGSFHFIPVYTTHLILACYIFFSVTSHVVAAIIGMAVTLSHLVVVSSLTYAYQNSQDIAKRVCSDFVYLLCINLLGLYFRYMNEIVKRKGFLDRRACVESTLKLKFEKEQEEQLMLSIIPKHILVEVRRDMLSTIEYIEKTDRLPIQKPFENPYINAHDNVTILYADIVNYTEMTTKLKPVTKLVETLNELFGRFDDASEELKVLRIKFLGDCYYCVAGLPPDPAPNHGEACVDLGLKMIEIIREVRDRKDLGIDMRIGVHSGKIMSGLIGLLKWQFDVWSNDVDIANRMETTGVPGRVHITKQTKDLLKKPYNITPTTKGTTDNYLKNHSIETYLITPDEKPFETTTPPYIHRQLNSNNLPFTISENENENFIVKNMRRQQLEVNGFLDSPKQVEEEDTVPQHKDVLYSKRFSGNPNLVNFGGVDKRKSGLPNSSHFYTQGLNRRSGSSTNLANKERRPTPGEVQRRTAFMDNNINRYQERLKNSDICMQKAIETMPLSKYDQWIKMNEINPFLLVFHNLRKEVRYIQLPDALFKYYLLAEILILISVVIIQNLTLTQWAWSAWLCYGTISFIAVVLIPLTWTQSIYSKYFDKYLTNEPPTNPFLRFLYLQSEKVAASLPMRIGIYVVVCSLFVSGVFTELVECSKLKEGRIDEDQLANPVSFILFNPIYFPFRDDEYECELPWHMSETAALAVFMSFSFLRIPLWLKFLFGSIITLFYSICVWSFGDEFYKGSETINYNVKPRSAHIILMVFLTFTLHLIDRQTDYMHKLDFQWNEQITSEQKTANTMHKINNMLLNNILPIHVADLYLNVNRQSSTELYHEEYSNVAVMFASVVDFEVPDLNDSFVLKIMNQIIGDFDKILGKVDGKPIEKIKVAKWTYMAACGLDPGRRDSDTESQCSKSDAVITLLEFAVNMMERIENINREMINSSIKLRIGIAHGELMAGVIGSKKPLYDIWGNPVNMASRMDSTGVPGKIQIPEATARVIENHGILCKFRANINVKGISGLVPTYFVGLDEANQLMYSKS